MCDQKRMSDQERRKQTKKISSQPMSILGSLFCFSLLFPFSFPFSFPLPLSLSFFLVLSFPTSLLVTAPPTPSPTSLYRSHTDPRSVHLCPTPHPHPPPPSLFFHSSSCAPLRLLFSSHPALPCPTLPYSSIYHLTTNNAFSRPATTTTHLSTTFTQSLIYPHTQLPR